MNPTPPVSLEAKRALLAERLRQQSSPVPPSPLSFGQQRLWFLDQLEPNRALYNIPSLARLTGRLDLSALERALNQVVARHESLRTHFECVDENPVQVIAERPGTKLRFVDLSARHESEREAEAQKAVREQVNRPFDLGRGPLLRATVLRLEPSEWLFVLVIHHIVADEWSLRVFFRELKAAYEAAVSGQRPAWDPLPIQYADYASWQRDRLGGQKLEKQLAYWRQQLAGNPPILELPGTGTRRSAVTFNGTEISRRLESGLADGLKALAVAHDATLFMVLLSAFQALLHRYTQLEDIIVGSPIAGRNQLETEGLIGFFVNTLLLRANVAGNPGFDELLRRVRQATLEAYAHSEVPFEKLVEDLQPERSLAHLPFTRVMFVVQNSPLDQLDMADVHWQFLEVATDTSKFDLTLVVQDTARGLVARVEYNTDLFDRPFIERLLAHYELLLHGIVAEPARRISELPLMPAAERRQLLTEWNSTATDYSRERTINDLFEAQAARAPHATAAVFGAASITYGELNERSNQLANYLKRFGVGPDVLVGVAVERSLDMLVAFLGILKTGGAYVPLDPAYPRERLAFMLSDTRAPVLLTQQKVLAHVPPQCPNVVCLDSDWELVARESRQSPSVPGTAGQLAYVMYTSGSTGHPKGVAVAHRGIARLVLNTDYIRLDSSDRIAQVSNISFDAATFEIWGALLNGGQLRGIAQEIMLSPVVFGRELREQHITAMFLTAAVFNQIAAEAPGALESLRTLIVGGEALDPKWVRAVLNHQPPQRLLNGYGPTENTTFTCCYWIKDLPEDATHVPIGRPIANTRVYILDPHLNPVPVGVPGQLYAGGDGLARGYWNRPELTQEKFVPNPFILGETLYQTGDLARFLADGNIEYLGRIDHQVKIRGFRIELGEIEIALSRHPAVRDCAVTVQGNTSITKRLVAYVVPAQEPAPNASELRRFLAETLPEYMVPAGFLMVGSLPLTPNGKVDRKALPEFDGSRPVLERQYQGPRDELEQQLVRIWEKVLGVSPIGIQDKFFDLGGHSLLAVKVTAQIEKALGRKLRLAALFQAPTIEKLAEVLRAGGSENGNNDSLVEIHGGGSRSPLFLVHGAGGGMFWGYINLSRHLGQEQPVYGFKSRSLDGREEFASIEEIAANYVKDLRRLQPGGPYHLGGYCFGGNVAFEMARQLAAAGQEVAFLGLLNCAPPNSRYTRIPWTPRWGWRLARNLVYWGNYFLQWSATQRREFFRWKWSLLKKRVGRKLGRTSPALSEVDAGDLVDLSAYTAEQRTTWEAHIKALLKYHPKSFPGRVYLFRSPGHPLWCSFDPDYGWGELAQGGVEVTIVPGAHEKILEEPCVQVLAQQVCRRLAAVPERSTIDPNNHASFGKPNATNEPAVSSPAAESDQFTSSGRSRAAESRSAPQIAQQPADSKRFAACCCGPRIEFPVHSSYGEHFAAQAQRTPAAVAVQFQGKSLNYGALNARANQLAHYLAAAGVGPESLVGVCLERSPELMVALLGILKAGGAYLPLDPAYPAERLAYMLRDSGTRLVLTQQKLVSVLPETKAHVICLDAPRERERINSSPAANPPVSAGPHNLAYVIYTSGSTGAPKGVEVCHRSLLNHNFAVAQAFQLQASDRVLQFTPLSFDISVEEIFATWLSGAAVVLRAEDAVGSAHRFFELLSRERVTVLNLPTAYWHEVVEHLHGEGAALPPDVRLVVIGGERASDADYVKWRATGAANVPLINGYGATEATVTSTLHVAGGEDTTLPIGRPLANTYVLVLNERFEPVPQGTQGELYIGGEGVARGYLKRPELTRERFIRNPFQPEIPCDRLYRTGDLGRFRLDGTLEFLGRADEQVKIRGFRIELGEVESVLQNHPGVRDGVVAVREDTPGQKRLAAYFVPRTGNPAAFQDLLKHFKQKLPAYMVPAALVPLQQLPRTPAGKVDRAALPAPDNCRPQLEAEFVPPQTPAEIKLAAIWQEVLGLNPVGVNDSFFDLGGHSLLAMQLASRIRDVFQVEISLEQLFARPTVARLARYLSEAENATGAEAEALSPSARRLPLSPRQRRLWLLEQFHPRTSPYNRTVGLRLLGPLDLDALAGSFHALAARHQALRAVFPTSSGEPEQYLCDPDQVKLPVLDLEGIPEAERERTAMARLQEAGRRSYIHKRPVLRPLLVRLKADEHWLVVVLHEIVADARSVTLVTRELLALYEANAKHQSAALPPPSGQYEVLASGLATGLSAVEESDWEYWRTQLAGAPELLELPSDRPRSPERRSEGARLTLALPEALSRAVEEFSLKQGCTVFAAFFSAFVAVLYRYTRAEDMVVGSLAQTGPEPGMEPLVANFENPVALRCDLSGEPTFLELVRRCEKVAAQAKAHSSLPFADLVDRLGQPRDASYSRVFQTSFVLDENPLQTDTAGGLKVVPFLVDNHTSKLALSMQLEKASGGLAGWVEYSTALFDRDRIVRLVEHFTTLLEAAMRQPDQKLARLPLLPAPELSQVLEEWNHTSRDYPRSKSLVDLFLEQARRAPQREVLVCGEKRLTYGELYSRSVQIADCLRSWGAGPGSLVAVCLDRSADLVPALLGTLLTGAAYVPLDPAYPQDRLKFVLEDSQAKVLITQSHWAASLPNTGARTLALDTWVPGPAASEHAWPAIDPASPAYVIYTSGSTGKPKGVVIEHRNAVAFVCWAKEAFTAQELSGVLASTSVCFDLSIFELFVPLSWGGKVILAENALAVAGLPAAHELTLINTVPSAMRELLRLKCVPDSVQTVNLAGEPLPTSLVDRIYRETSIRRVYDLYGPTETTTYSTFALRLPGVPATVGRPLANEQVFLFDANLEPVPIGIPGELYIGGAGVARGYLNRPDLTTLRFVPHPLQPGERLYRTGDLARWKADGTLEYIGRTDHQVKIRGFRIEPGEIEAVLRAHPAVKEAAVLAREDRPGDKRLVAYLVPAAGQPPSTEQLREWTQSKLPAHMVPSAFVLLDSMPLTPNGKLDRAALPAPDLERVASENFVEPQTDLQAQVLAIWREVLGVERIGIHDNFFALGGHSLLATRVISRLREKFANHIPLVAFFASPTIEALADGLASGRWAEQGSPALAPRRVERQATHAVSFVQERLWFLDQLEPGSPAYNVPTALHLKGELNVAALQRALNELARRHEALRTVFRYTDECLTQVIVPKLEVPIVRSDFSKTAAEARRQSAEAWLEAQAQRPFDLARGPLLRAALARLGKTEHRFLLVLHHTISDGWSLAIFLKELQVTYDALCSGAAVPSLPELPLQYVDYAEWQRRFMHGPVLERELAYWKEKLAGAPTTIELPVDEAGAGRTSPKGNHRSIVIDESVSAAMAELAHQEGCTLFMMLMAGLAITLHKWTGQRDLIVGTVMAGRNHREFEKILGCFMNFVPLRCRLSASEAAREVLRAVRTTVLEGQAHQDCPFEKIVESVNPERRLDRNPLYNVALLLQNFPEELFPSSSLRATPMAVSTGAALLDLRFEAENTPHGLSLSCEFRTDLFNESTIERLLGSYVQVLETLVRRPQQAVSDFRLNAQLETQVAALRARRQGHQLALTATFTAEPLAEPLRYWLQDLELPGIVEFAPYNQVFQQLLDPGSLLGTNPRGLNVVLVRVQDWQSSASAPNQAGADGPEQNVTRNVREFLAALKAAASRSATPFLVCLCPPSKALLAQAARAAFLEAQEADLVAGLAELPGVYLLTAEELRRWYPVTDYDDPSGEELGHVPYTPLFFSALGTAIVRKYHALQRPPLKVIALDCDNTLWSGVCGEDGPQGLRLEPPYQALQNFVRIQQEAGCLLCLCSKNNEADVLEVFAQRDDMPLRLQHIAARRVNWNSKSENLKALARELQVGLDSFAFLDDNPVECAEVEANCPEVLTLQIPEDSARIPQFLQHCWVFDRLKVTSEDRRRAQFYRENQQREQLRSRAPSLADFISSLNLQVEIVPLAPEHLQRVSQLTHRTNQFTATAARLNENEVRQRADGGMVLTVRVSDRFGDYGLAGVMIARTEPERSLLTVEAFLLSCRVLGRGVEHRMVARLGQEALAAGLLWVDLHYVKTDRNKPAFDFLQSLGSEYRQPLNGGYVFRLPADFAAKLEFRPIDSAEPAAPGGAQASAPAAPASPARKFQRCRALALEANDPSAIHRRIEAARVVHHGGPRAEYAAPRSELERKLCELWQALLHVEKIGTHDNFFELGGHSLLAVRLFADIEKITGRKYPLVTLFQAPTVEQLAAMLSQPGGASSRSLLVGIQPQGARPPLFLVHGAGGDVLWGYANLAAHLPADQPVYGIKSRGQAGLEESSRLEDMAAEYLEAVRAFQPQGPYFLGGYCFGGNVAYEMARQLHAQGERVALLALVDSAPANAGYERVPWWKPAYPFRFARNFRYWLQDFAGLPAADRRNFVARKARFLARKLAHRFRNGAGRPVVDLEEVIDPGKFPENELKLWQVHLRALVEHQQHPYPGHVTLLRTHGQPLFCSLEEDFCWGALARGGVRVKYVPGSHENIFLEPHVQTLAGELAGELAAAQANTVVAT